MDVDTGLRSARDRTPTHGYEPTRDAAMTAFAKSWRRDEKGYSGNWKRLSMSTTVLAYLILFMGFITFLCGAFGVLMLDLRGSVQNGARPVQILRDGGRTDIRRPWHDRYWAGPAAAADPWQGVIPTGNRTPLTHGYAETREAAMAAFAKSWRAGVRVY